VDWKGLISAASHAGAKRPQNLVVAVNEQPNPRQPMAAAMDWVSRIITVALEMVVPGLAGGWLDKRWGTSFLALVGFAIGVSMGIWHLIVMTSPKRGDQGMRKSGKNQDL
jgi:hypothetical protein